MPEDSGLSDYCPKTTLNPFNSPLIDYKVLFQDLVDEKCFSTTAFPNMLLK